MRHNIIETVMGAVVLLVAALFLFFAYTSANLRAVKGYSLTADFTRLGGLQVGGDVRISGVKVGSIAHLTLDPKTYLAHVEMTIQPDVHLPTDTVAAIRSESLLGGRYMALDPGGEEDLLPPGGRLQHTSDPMDIESLISKYMFSGSSQAAQPAAAPETAAHP